MLFKKYTAITNHKISVVVVHDYFSECNNLLLNMFYYNLNIFIYCCINYDFIHLIAICSGYHCFFMIDFEMYIPTKFNCMKNNCCF